MAPEIDIAAIGCGPANLSLGALLATATAHGKIELTWGLFEERSVFDWHPGQLLPGSLMQSEWYRDLVSPLEPTSEYSFLNYLKHEQRLFRFLNSGIILPERAEFNAYLKWVAERMQFLNLGHRCTGVFYDKESKHLRCEFSSATAGNVQINTKNIVIGVGAVPRIPEGLDAKIPGVTHISELLDDADHTQATDVLIVGGGQSGAEAFLYFLEQGGLFCRSIYWITRDTCFRILDTGHFAREFYSPSFSHQFHALPPAARLRLLESDKAAGEGISPSVAERIYRAMYRLEYDSGRFVQDAVRVAGLRTLQSVSRHANGLSAKILDEATNSVSYHSCDYVVLCTGFQPAPLTFLEGLLPDPNGECSIAEHDYSFDRGRFPGCKLFVQSRCDVTHGLGDPNLVAAAGRCATILNAIAQANVFEIPLADNFVKW